MPTTCICTLKTSLAADKEDCGVGSFELANELTIEMTIESAVELTIELVIVLAIGYTTE